MRVSLNEHEHSLEPLINPSDNQRQSMLSGVEILALLEKGKPHMNLEAQLTALKTEKRNLPLTERVTLSCRLAKHLEKAGRYELACEALAEFWPDRNESPKLGGLDDDQKADVLLRIGAIAGWLGSADQMVGGQETAKNILTKSIEIFEGLTYFGILKAGATAIPIDPASSVAEIVNFARAGEASAIVLSP
ncbi:MAG TPA: hypothetical protein VNG71_08340, partial [Pyrinomonadaceae bacterium]|nr:hypothetical protein [Pyrinomonadaceae bacterium]